MAEVVFISPNATGTVSNESVGTLLLATILREHGVQSDILQYFRFGDIENFDSFLNTATEMILNEHPKIVSFYTRCDNYHIMLKIAEQIKEVGDFYIVFGGPQADISAVQTLREIPYVDYICCGEGENTIYPFFSSLLNKKPDLTVPGLVYRSEDRIVQNPRPQLIENLDDLPEIDYSVLPYSISSKGPFDIDAGRGCPFGCTYCSTKTFWGRKYRLKSPQRIIKEIKGIHEKYHISYFTFDHDMFTMNRKKVIETCTLIKELDFPVMWNCSARVDCIDKELIDIMVESGLHSIYFGIETGSDRMQKIINKNLDLNNVYDMLAYVQSKNVNITVSFIYGFPEETEEDISKTIALIGDIAKLKVDRLQTHLCTFLPGTELSRKYHSLMKPSTNYSNITGKDALAECAELIEAHPAIFSHFSEYPTDLRNKLEYFDAFVKTWRSAQPIYQYLSEKYPRDQLFKMYCDFVEANRKILEQTKDLTEAEIAKQITENDQFVKQFTSDENYDIISDYYRMHSIKHSKKLTNAGDQITELFCFSPADIENCSCLQEFRRKLSIVTYIKNQDGSIQIQVRNRVKS